MLNNKVHDNAMRECKNRVGLFGGTTKSRTLPFASTFSSAGVAADEARVGLAISSSILPLLMSKTIFKLLSLRERLTPNPEGSGTKLQLWS